MTCRTAAIQEVSLQYCLSRIADVMLVTGTAFLIHHSCTGQVSHRPCQEHVNAAQGHTHATT